MIDITIAQFGRSSLLSREQSVAVKLHGNNMSGSKLVEFDRELPSSDINTRPW
jgi:hypothetical protein